ncbi:hypothetical protein GKZ89_15260 [Bacillus mangrovi]|uniref:Nucleotidyltransferase family protein n=1 Tax=Metabacillus mangrovi TaxID=1491830 RepID=A0A7X2S7T0_9BACI|nr:nucleotidyltransferase family protein [Metabacillus mangrovi]MTH54761.1 hypothetical protein [Metabacillus mangrovi]
MEENPDYEEQLVKILDQSEWLPCLFSAASKEIGHYYIGAGCIVQTVWNVLLEKQPLHGIGDADVIFFDKDRLSDADETILEYRIKAHLPDSFPKLDVKNQARVHLWYERKFGYPAPPYHSMEEAIDTWPSTATAIGVRKAERGYEIYAPFGLEDLFQLTVRPNKKLVSKEVYESKAEKWKSKWPELKVIEW